MNANIRQPRNEGRPLGNAHPRTAAEQAKMPARSHRTPARGNQANYIYAALTNVGRTRDHNEDAVLAQPPLFVVADGLGGHDAGEVASTVAIEAMAAHAPKRPDRQSLAKAVRAANQAVVDAVESGLGPSGMGTTLTAMVIGDGRVCLAQVGDSRAYLLRSGRLSQVTDDHSVVAALVRSGTLTESEAARHPQRNVITRALGAADFAEPDTYMFDTVRGDRWLLCSDGLTTMMPNDILAQVLVDAATPSQAVERLVLAANDAGGYDNITVVVVDIVEDCIPAAQVKASRRWWLWALVWVVAVVIIAAVAGAGVYTYAMSRAYLARGTDGTVAVYRGVAGEVAGQSLSALEEDTDIQLADLTTQDYARVCEGAQYASLEDARDALDEMVERGKAAQSLVEPQ